MAHNSLLEAIATEVEDLMSNNVYIELLYFPRIV